MNVTIIAKTDREVYAAKTPDGDFVVFDLVDGSPAQLSDVVRGDFRGHGMLGRRVHNVTQRIDFDVCLQDWACGWEKARSHLERIGPPSRIWVAE